MLQASQGQVLPPAVREQLSGAVVLPSLFLRDTIPSFQVGAIPNLFFSESPKYSAGSCAAIDGLSVLDVTVSLIASPSPR